MTKTFLSPLVCNAVVLGDSLPNLDIATVQTPVCGTDSTLSTCLKAAFSFKPMPAASRVPKKSPI